MLDLLPLLLVGPQIAVSDFKFHRIPNRALIALLIMDEIIALNRGWVRMATSNASAMLILFAGALFYILAKGAIGMGDIKLFALLTLLLEGFSKSMAALTYAALIALIYAVTVRKRTIPFGPALICGAIVVILGG